MFIIITSLTNYNNNYILNIIFNYFLLIKYNYFSPNIHY